MDSVNYFNMIIVNQSQPNSGGRAWIWNAHMTVALLKPQSEIHRVYSRFEQMSNININGEHTYLEIKIAWFVVLNANTVFAQSAE